MHTDPPTPPATPSDLTPPGVNSLSSLGGGRKGGGVLISGQNSRPVPSFSIYYQCVELVFSGHNFLLSCWRHRYRPAIHRTLAGRPGGVLEADLRRAGVRPLAHQVRWIGRRASDTPSWCNSIAPRRIRRFRCVVLYQRRVVCFGVLLRREAVSVLSCVFRSFRRFGVGVKVRLEV